MKQNTRSRIIIIALSVLLALSLLALAGTSIYRMFAAKASADTLVPDNIITPGTESSGLSGTDSGDIEGEPVLSSRVNPVGSVYFANAGQIKHAAPESAARTGSVTPEIRRKAAEISLYQNHAEDNQPFQAVNMFPGDAETKYYCVKVSHSGEVVVHFRADVRPGYEKLAEVLYCRVVLPATGETMYDGLMRDMPESVQHSLKTYTDTESELYYEITAYLDTSVGNEYQNQNLIADFRWWVEDIGSLEPPHTGDSTNLLLLVAIATGSMVVILILEKKRRKEACGNG